MGINESSSAPNQRDVRMREDALYPTTQLGNNGSHSFASLIESSGVNIGLGGNAAHIQTRTSHLSILEDGHLQALLGSIFSGAVTTRARADDEKIRLTPLPLPIREGSI